AALASRLTVVDAGAPHALTARWLRLVVD
ncbi:MAG: hypothetical protein QOE84_1326, partial [Actinomycetota bacterium]|nr:hypothetical protein [Actinomycetota bacterium]